MRQRTYPGSEITIEERLRPQADYDRYIASYLSEGLKIYALLTIPHGQKPEGGWPVILFNHGYIPPEQYRTTERYVAYVDALARSGSGIGDRLYAADATRRTYEYLARLTGDLLDAGWPVIVDATFIARWQRDLLREQAQSRGVAFHIFDFRVAVATLRERILKRTQLGNDASDADLAVLQHQLDTEEPLAIDEQAGIVSIDASEPILG